MSMLRSLDASENSSSESNLYVGRKGRNGLPGTSSVLNKMRVQYRPELGGITLNSNSPLDSYPPAELHPQLMELLSKSSLSDIERQAILRAVKLKTVNSPISPLSPVDSLGLYESASHPNHNAGSYSQLTQQQNDISFHCQGSSYNPASFAEVLVSSGGRYPSLPMLQSVPSLQKSMSSDNLTRNYVLGYPNVQSSAWQRTALYGNALRVEEPECIRQRLQELERELLSDSDEVSAISPEQSSYLDREWADTIENLLFEDCPSNSPMESTNSTIYNGNEAYPTIPPVRPQTGNKERSFSALQTNSLQQVQPTPISQQNVHVHAGSSSKQLLIECAAAISEGKLELATNIISELRQMVSIQGDPMQRLSAYMVEGLVARIASSGQGLYKALKCKEPPTTDNLSAMQILFEVCPYFKFGFMAANGVIAEAFKDKQKVHILDFDIGQGNQYIVLIQTLAARAGGPPHLRITGVDDPESVQRPIGGLNVIGKRLVQLAETIGVPFQFNAIAEKTGDVQPWMLDCRPDEVLAVNFAFQLHHMPDESVSTKNPRDRLLRMVKSLNPKVVTVVEQEVNTNTAPFFPRFMEAFSYYSSVFESLDATLPRDSKDRMNVEKQCLARDIVNIIACEGAERIERYEMAGKWRARMNMAGFSVYPLSTHVNNNIKSLLQSYCNSYKLKEEGGAMYFGWLDRNLIVASAWH
eukprot:Gb_30494 [translate_table: standard]